MTISVCETCGSAFRETGETCPDCGAPAATHGEIRRLPQEVVLQFLDHAEEFLTAGPLRQLALAFAAGSFITFGAVLSVALTVDVDSVGISRLLLGLGFSAGFVLVIAQCPLDLLSDDRGHARFSPGRRRPAQGCPRRRLAQAGLCARLEQLRHRGLGKRADAAGRLGGGRDTREVLDQLHAQVRELDVGGPGERAMEKKRHIPAEAQLQVLLPACSPAYLL